MAKLKSNTRGIRNNNPLNIRKGNSWKGERHPQSDPAFEEFETVEMGIRAAIILAYNYITGRAASCRGQRMATVTQFITKWAPPSENNTQAYISRVCQRATLTPHESLYPIRKNQLLRLLWAMAEVECGQLLHFQHFENAYAYARLVLPSLPR